VSKRWGIVPPSPAAATKSAPLSKLCRALHCLAPLQCSTTTPQQPSESWQMPRRCGLAQAPPSTAATSDECARALVRGNNMGTACESFPPSLTPSPRPPSFPTPSLFISIRPPVPDSTSWRSASNWGLISANSVAGARHSARLAGSTCVPARTGTHARACDSVPLCARVRVRVCVRVRVRVCACACACACTHLVERDEGGIADDKIRGTGYHCLIDLACVCPLQHCASSGIA